MISLFQILRESPGSLAPSSRFTVFNGVLYLCAGAVFLVWPGVVQTFLLGPPFEGREESLTRVLGMAVAIIGWFYIFGGRSGARQVVAASVLDRVVLVPLVLGPLALSGVFPAVLGAFAVLDPVLGLIAWYLLAREGRAANANESQATAEP